MTTPAWLAAGWFWLAFHFPSIRSTAISTPAIPLSCPVRFNGGAPLDSKKVKARIAAAEKKLKGHGRLLIRKSGTEPLIRVMAEGDDEALVERLVDDICEAVASA